MELNLEELKLEKLLREVNTLSPSEESVKKIISEFDKNIYVRNYDLIFFRVILAIIIICFSSLFSVAFFANKNTKIDLTNVTTKTFGEINNTLYIIIKSVNSIFANYSFTDNSHILLLLAFFMVYLVLREFEIISWEL